MGIRASFRIVTPEAFAACQADPAAELPRDGERFDIGKTWFNFHHIFRGEAGPLRFVIAGDVAEKPLEGNLILEESQGEDEGDCAHFGYVSPVAVKAIAEELKKFPRWKMVDRLRREQPMWVQHKDGRDRFCDAFDELNRAYATAAKLGAALQIVIC